VFGEVFICQFPFTSGAASKARPVLTLFDLQQDVIVCRITSVLRSGQLDITMTELAASGTRQTICGAPRPARDCRTHDFETAPGAFERQRRISDSRCVEPAYEAVSQPTSPNDALRRTAARVKLAAPAASRRSPPATFPQPARHALQSLSLGSFGDSERL